jgi:outer membrane protein assembly factor BamE (lipoprotein component of BamABCDE complex)
MIGKETILNFIIVPLAAMTLGLNTGCDNSSGSDNKVVVTQAEYSQIQNGMSYNQVVAIIGSDGVQDTSSGNGTSYVWQNSDGSEAAVVFDMSGHVIGKANSGNLP